MKFLKTLKIILSLKYIFQIPKKSKVAEFGIGFYHDIFNYYFNKESIENIPIINQKVNLYILFKCLFSNQKDHILDRYYKTYINYINPKIIITNQDNNTFFFTISKEFKNIKTIAVQNGRRSISFDIFSTITPNKNYFVDYFFVFGDSIGEHYSKYIKGKKISIGSFVNNHLSDNYKYRKNKILTNKLENVFFISSWRPLHYKIDHYGNKISQSQIYYAYKLIIIFLNDWCLENNKKLYINLCTLKNSVNHYKEVDFYKSLINEGSFSLIPRESRYYSYELLNNEGIFTFTDSTLGYESLARGNKTAFFGVISSLLKLESLNYSWPLKLSDYGPFWCNKLDYEYFSKILEFLFKVNESEWLDIKSQYIDPVIKYDKKNKKFKKIIREIF